MLFKHESLVGFYLLHVSRLSGNNLQGSIILKGREIQQHQTTEATYGIRSFMELTKIFCPNGDVV